MEQDDVIVGVELLVSQFVDANAESFKAFLRATQTSSPAQNAPPLQTSSNEGDKSEATTKSGEEQAKSAGQPGTASSGSSSEVAASTLPPTDEFLKDLPTLHEIFKKEVMVKLIPEVADLANQIRFQSQRGRLQQQVDSGDRSRGVPDRDDPLRVPGSGGRPRGPIPRGGYDDDYDTGYSGEPNPFAYSGDSDLFGSVGRYGEGGGFGALPSMGRGGIGRGGMGRGGGGSSVGPHHPGFGPEVSDPSRYGPGGSAGGGGAPPGYFHPPPPGARFDPFGPVVPPSHGGAPTYGGNSRSGGNPEAPPGFENWYS